MWSQRDPSIRKSGVGNIFIKNLDPVIGHKELYDTFSAFGNILSCKVAVNETGQSKGFGFVHFEGADAADRAIKVANEKLMGNKQVFVGKFVPKKERNKQKESSWTNVYVKDLDLSMDEKELERLFGQHGKLTSVVIMRNDDETSKCFGFVNFEAHEDAMKAVEIIHGQTWGGKKIWCGRAQKKSEREAELKKRFHQIKLERLSRFQGINLYIKNLEDEIDEERLKKEFSSFGGIRSAKIMMDDKGNSKGFGFICYSLPEEAQNAITEMNNRILQGCTKPLYVALHEPKEVRRTKLAQRHAARKLRLNPPSSTPAPIPYPQSVFYGNGNVPSFVYAPPQQPPLLPRQRGATPWSQTPPFPTPPYPVQGLPGRGGRGAGAMAGRAGNPPSAPAARGRGTSGVLSGTSNLRRNQSTQGDGNLEAALAHVLALPEEQQKLYLGEQLYPLILKIEKGLAGKITGMLLDSGWSVEELYSLVVDESKLLAKIEEARSVLARAHQAGELEEGDGTPDQPETQINH